jgi:Na+-translocating ferredoxin:NAD+ oxidoreductase RnfD subunit
VVNQQFLKDHLIDFEVAAALVGLVVAHFYFGFGWIVSVILALSAFILIPLLILCWFYVRYKVRVILIMKRSKD